MLSEILFLGNNFGLFSAVQQALNRSRYHLTFHSSEEFHSDSDDYPNIDLIIIDTVSLSKNLLNLIYSIKKESAYSGVPVLALTGENPAGLRYRLINAGADDYQSIPFDKLDLEIKVENLIRLRKKAEPKDEDEEVNSVAVIKKLTHLVKEFRQPLLNFDLKAIINDILLNLERVLSAQAVLLLEMRRTNSVELRYASPDELANNSLELGFAGLPILEKAIRMREPTILNKTTSENPLIARLNSALRIRADSIIAYPLVFGEKLHSVLIALRSGQQKFLNGHYLTVQVFAELINQALYLNETNLIEKKQLDRKAWNFYYDFLEKMVNNLDFGIIALDKQLRIKFLNEKAAGIFRKQQKELLYNPLTSVLSEEEVQAILTFKEPDISILERPELKIEVGKKEKILLGFSVYHFKDKTDESGYIISMKDITIRKGLQEQKSRIERLDSLGIMASGLAHEIRNPLAGIKAIAQTLEEEIDPHDSRIEYLKRIIRQVNRLDDLLKSLYSFARPRKPNRDYCSIENILRDAIESLQENINQKHIRFVEKLHSNLPDVYVDSKQIEQVLSSVIMNSIDAVNSEGEIEVSVKSLGNGHPVSKEHFRSLVYGKPYIDVNIRDNGSGILPENLDKIFDPFFTTKNKAPGLGLSIAYQTVRQNGGLIYFESDAASGTECHLILPVHETKNSTLTFGAATNDSPGHN